MKVKEAETQPSYILQYLNERALRAIEQRQRLLTENAMIVETTRSLAAEIFKIKRYDRQSMRFLDCRHNLIMAINHEKSPPESSLTRLKK